MITSIIGYPKVGSIRELKFATEKYFRNEIDLQQLQECAGNIKSTQWKMLKEKGFGNEKNGLIQTITTLCRKLKMTLKLNW